MWCNEVHAACVLRLLGTRVAVPLTPTIPSPQVFSLPEGTVSNLRCVVLNGCETLELGLEIVRHLPHLVMAPRLSNSRRPNPESQIPNLTSRIPNPTSRIPNPKSQILVSHSRHSVGPSVDPSPPPPAAAASFTQPTS